MISSFGTGGEDTDVFFTRTESSCKNRKRGLILCLLQRGSDISGVETPSVT